MPICRRINNNKNTIYNNNNRIIYSNKIRILTFSIFVREKFLTSTAIGFKLKTNIKHFKKILLDFYINIKSHQTGVKMLKVCVFLKVPIED